MKLKRRGIGALVAVGLVAAFLLPVVPANAARYSAPSTVPPVNVGVLRDPTGTYDFTLLANGTYSMNFTAYQKLLKDPYTGIAATSVKIEGNTVLITPPTSNVVSGPDFGTERSEPVSSPVSASSREFQSVTAWLSGQGAILAQQGYSLEFG